MLTIILRSIPSGPEKGYWMSLKMMMEAWMTGMCCLCKMLPKICASLRLKSSLWQRLSRIPLNHAYGLYSALTSAL